MIYNPLRPFLILPRGVYLPYYPLMYLLGFVICFAFLLLSIKREWIKKFYIKQLIIFILFNVFGIIMGARLFFLVFYYTSYPVIPEFILKNPEYILKIWTGGMSFHGGLIGCLLSSYLFCRLFKVDFLQLADLSVMPGALALGFGRLGNLFNNSILGTVSNSPLCMVFINKTECALTNMSNSISNIAHCNIYMETCRHPYLVYAIITMLLMFGICFVSYFKIQLKEKSLELEPRKTKKGFTFLVGITFYGLTRVMIDFIRDEPRFFGLSTGQYLSIIMFLVGMFFLYTYYRK